MADHTPDSPGGRPSRPAVPPFRGPAGPAGARPPIARPAAPPAGRATLPPFAAPVGAPRRATPASSPALARPVPPRPAAAPTAAVVVPPKLLEESTHRAEPAAPAVEGAQGAAGNARPAGAPTGAVAGEGDWLTPDSAIVGEFGDLVEHKPVATARPPQLPTPPMPWPAVATSAEAASEAADDGDWAALEGEMKAGTNLDEPLPEVPSAASDDWSLGYEAEAAALLGDEGTANEDSADPASYLADDGPADQGARPVAAPAEIPPSMLPTPVIGVPTLGGATWGWPGEGAASGAHAESATAAEEPSTDYGVAPPDPLLEDAMRDEAGAAADAWNDPLADEPLGGGGRDEPMGAYGAATPYLVAAHDYGTAAHSAGDADAVADALQRVAAWVRSGELPVSVPPTQAPTEAQALTAALAALLGLGAQR